MDLPSNVCIACSCRSTRPFQTFLVSIIDQPWLGSTKYVPVSVSKYRIPLPHPRTGTEVSETPFIRYHTFACSRIPSKGSGLVWNLVATSALVYLILHCLFHHTSILGIFITFPYTRLPSASNIVEFLVFSAEKGSETPTTLREILDF